MSKFFSFVIFTLIVLGANQCSSKDVIQLPVPTGKGKVSVEEAIKNRRTIRSFASRAIKLVDLSQILWAAQGITGEGGLKRAAPSAGALYPLDLYIILGEKGVEGLKSGIYHYFPSQNSIERLTDKGLKVELAQAALGQMWIAEAPVVIVITAEYERVTGKYGPRGVRYAHMEAGHVGENIFIQAVALDLAAGIVGAFENSKIIKLMGIPASHDPLLIMPLGYQKKR
ncbi:MAG: SagB/ThcOx family dehydrogenase [Deltaproteobacteria bacterium]|nr:MAG: SagB/ThcOx family dehydrogenase [Deltaproteobacteria bacterium]